MPRALVALLCLVLALGACGGDDDSGSGGGTAENAPATASATPELSAADVSAKDDEAIRTTVGRYYIALAAGDGATVCSLLAERARSAAEAKGGGSCEKGAAADPPDGSLKGIGDVAVTGDRATAEVRLEAAASTVEVRVDLVRAGDEWLVG